MNEKMKANKEREEKKEKRNTDKEKHKIPLFIPLFKVLPNIYSQICPWSNKSKAKNIYLSYLGTKLATDN